MKKKQILYPGLLLLLAALLVILSYIPGSLYGSGCDWFAQHVSIAETMRQTILEESTLFPGQLPLGGGNNIYDFSYYGYLRPDVLLSCLLPEVPMEYIITAYSIAGYLVAVLLFYILLKKMNRKDELALLGGILFLCAGCFFQIHRQIMFINYMPFLLGALLCVLKYHKTEKKLLLILMMFFIVMHSYYYAISAWVVIYLFLLYTADWRRSDGLNRQSANGIERNNTRETEQDERKEESKYVHRRTGGYIRKLWSLTWRYGTWALTAVAMAGILLLPTAASILNCATSKDGGSAGTNPWEIRLDFSALLYNGYGLGLTLSALFLLVLALCWKKGRLLATVLLFTLVCGLVPLVLNGFLYNRAKILIPFLPLVLVLCMETLWHFWVQKKSPPLWTLLPVILATCLQYKAHGVGWVWVDLVLVALVFGVMSINGGCIVFRIERQRKKIMQSHKNRSLVIILAIMCTLAFCFALEVHRNDDMIKQEETITSRFSEEERETFYQDRSYRFDTLRSPYQTSNSLLAYGVGRTSMYTSTTNPIYSTFFYDEIRNPIGNDNRVGLYNRANPFFQYLMGVRYLEATEETLPWGYEIKQQNANGVLAENKKVLPLCYGSTQLLSESEYEQLEFPANLEALVNYSVVEMGKCIKEGTDKTATSTEQIAVATEFTSHFNEIYLEEGVDYEIRQDSESKFTIIPKEPIEDQILVVTFHVEAKSGEEISITINGTANRLSGDSAPYPNHNENFTYFLSSNEPMTEFKVKTSGDYEISDLHIYSLDTSYFGGQTVYPLMRMAEENATESELPEQSQIPEKKTGAVLHGTITMPTAGYCITSLPIQAGYRAYVDGEEGPIETVNQAFIGFPLEAGIHEIAIYYEPPLQKAGMVMSVIGWLLWIGCMVYDFIEMKEK